MSSWFQGKFKGRGIPGGDPDKGNIAKNLFSGKVKTREGIISAVNRAIRLAAAQTKKDVQAWVEKYVPEDTGYLISTFWFRQPAEFASRENQLVRYKIQMGFDAPYAKHVNELYKKRQVTLTKATSTVPFWGPLQEYARQVAMRNLQLAMAEMGLKFNIKTMRVED